MKSFLTMSLLKNTALTLLLICGFTTIVMAGSTPELRLKTGNQPLSANLEQVILNPSIAPGELFNGFYFRIIQFDQIPSSSQKEILLQAGIRLTSYLPDRAFQAVISQNANLSALRQAGARSVVVFQPKWKLSRDLYNNFHPDHALTGKDQIDLVVRYNKGMDPEQVMAFLTTAGHSIIRRYDYSSWIEIRTSVDRIMELASLPFVNGLEPIAPPSTPDDEKGRSLHRSNAINGYTPMGRHYDGTGVSAALADDGPVGPHIDYQGRIDQSNTTANSGTHGDMTTGILMGAGNLNPTIAGMGTGAFIYIYDIGGYNHILNSPNTNQTLGVLVTSTSYSQGCNDYTTDTQTGDQILNQNPTLLHVYSAGNNGTGNCQYGAGAGWGNITGGYKIGKNVIACGNLNYLDVLENSSSRGPADDGRIKPDICANGIDQMSTNGPNTYQVGGGTSAACPGIAGIVTQIHHAYRDLNAGATADGALVKACMLNTAEDLGNPGPDFKHGFGRVNALRAVKTLEDNRYLSDVISQGVVNTHTITIPANTQQLRLMLHWTDVEGDPLAAKALVNDLNLVVTDPSSTDYLPWVLDPTPNATALNSNAVPGVDDLNNSEQVTINNPTAGVYTISIDGFLIPQGPQKYYIVYEFVNETIEVTYPIGSEGFVPGETETIRWDAYGSAGTFAVEYSGDMGATWNTVAPSVPGNQRYYNWTVPTALTGQALIKVTRGSSFGQSAEPFSIIGLPSNIVVDWACPDSIHLTWSGATGAIGYEVSMLGAKYMDSVAYSTTTSATIYATINPTLGYWFSVRSYTPDNTKGRRANAIYKAPGVTSCPIAIDANMLDLVSPKGNLQNCQNLASQPIIVSVRNSGQSAITDIPVFYNVNNGPPVAEVVFGTLSSNGTTTYTFSATYDFSPIGVYTIRVWTDVVGDGNHYNDTLEFTLETVPGFLLTLPYSENFETFSACATTTNCEQGVCGLTDGWFNLTNLTMDLIDWRTSSGPTPSANTGPDQDHNPGTASGKYLYLEASACFQKEAIAVSPCFDLTTSANPQLEFWYHMYGASMGELHVDVYANDIWNNDVTPVITGNQGNSWQQRTVNLAAYAGQIVNVRFRGVTGNDYTSDMAIDDFNIYELSAPPVAAFGASATSICQGQTITLIDQSLNSPTSWNWSLTPATGYTFVNGTNATSQNPELQFTTNGVYDVSLTVFNTFGNNTYASPAYITVGNGAITPLVETFQGAVFPPANWLIENPDNDISWVQSGNITGAAGTTTNAAYMDNFVYNAAGEEDGLLTERIDLTNSLNPIMTFDVAYARYSAAYEDALRIDISTDCGVTFIPTGYFKQGTILATVPDQTATFAPTAAGQWRNDTLDLAGYLGSQIIVKFVNITGYGNSLYIDNINFHEGSSGINLAGDPGNSVTVYPNPGSGVFSLLIVSERDQHATIRVTDLKGAIVQSGELNLRTGENNKMLDLTGFGKGVYQLELQSESTTQILKLVVL